MAGNASALTAVPCPANMALVGRFCIDETASSGVYSYDALTHCAGENKTLCTTSQLYTACHAGAITIPSGGVWSDEWVVVGSQITSVVVQNLPDECGANRIADPSYLSEPFFCCQ